MASSFGPTVNLFPLRNYDIGVKDALHEKDRGDQLSRMRRQVEEEGMRTSVHGVILVQEHNHPHILLLQSGQFFKLPGGRVKPGEEDTEALHRKLNNKLAPKLESLRVEWECGDIICKWWRPNYEAVTYPYVPPHITSPKECIKLFSVSLPEQCKFAVPRNMALVAVPLFEIYDNKDRYGPVIASLPSQLSRFNFNYL